jgi:DNA polymerase
MDAKERLRIYLEQRRELGESELVLDGMPVDDVMALLGARQVARPGRTARGPVSSMVPPAAPTREKSPPPSEPESATPASATPASEAVAPPPPDARFDANANVNWRDALRDTLRNPAGSSATTGGAAARSASSDPVASGTAVLAPWLAALGLPAGIAAGESRAATTVTSITPVLAASHTLDEVAAHIRACSACALHASARNAVPGEGSSTAEVVCVGEPPEGIEDEQGRPFVGEAGQLFTKILIAIQLTRDDVYLCNVLKHRPPSNRDPLPDEASACQPYLRRQLELLKPRVILVLGRIAAQTLLETSAPIGKLRGQIHQYRGIPVIVTHSPASIVLNEPLKRPTWADVQVLRRLLDASRLAMPERS